ncbi:MAG TPA: DUF427 domain-containing protein [Acidimicrobiia bacterium]|nr:DUF427 domain-containing protein [Acidimicrobiia bacterium]
MEQTIRESVWDYPRPPRVETTDRLVRVEFADRVIAESSRSLRVLETSHPPVFYIPRSDFVASFIRPSTQTSFCEFKGEASYLDVVVEDRVAPDAGWEYPDPSRGYEALQDHVAFYPGRVGACFVDGERVKSQDGGFYGGWVTAEIVGPFKDAAGTRGW